MKAAIYTRLSLDREGETSTERQESDCRAYAQVRGWEVVAVHRDRLSGYKDVHRPGFEAFMADLRAGSVEVGLIWKLDRLTRKGVTGIAPILDALHAGGTALASVNDNIDTTTPMGKGVLAILASVAEQESHNTSLRTTSAKAAQARAGKPVMNSIRPFGYGGDRVTVVEEEAALLRDAARSACQGRTVYDIAREWEAAGVRGPSWTRRSGESVPGGVMSPESIGRILRSPRIAGFREYKGEQYPAVWPAILDPETAAAVQAVLAPGRRSPRVRSYLLTGGIFCGLCAGTLTPRVREGGIRQYQCVKVPGRPRNCGRIKVSAEAVEKWVEMAVFAGMEHLEVLAAPPADGKESLSSVMSADRELKARLEALQDARFVDGTLSEARFGELRDGLAEKRAALGRKMAEMTAVAATSALGADVDGRAAWAAWSLEERRQLVRAWWPRVEVYPALRGPGGGTGRTFQPARLRLVDRDGAGWRLEQAESGWELRPEARSDARYLPLG